MAKPNTRFKIFPQCNTIPRIAQKLVKDNDADEDFKGKLHVSQAIS